MRTSSRVLIAASSVALLAAAFAAPVSGATSRFNLSQILSGYSLPVLVTNVGDGSRVIFIVEQGGKIKRATFSDGVWKKLGTFLDLSARVNDPTKPGNFERGLLGLAFDPNYAQNGRFYVNYTRRGSGGKKGDTIIAEYRRESASKADPSSRRVVMTINQPGANHNGGHLAFGPDGLLYIGLGDGGGSGNGQKLKTRLGKLLRIDPRDPDGSGPKRYRIPGSNPRVGKTGRNDIWAWGLRNPWRYSFDRKNGNLWIGDVGQSAREEVDRSKSNRNGRRAGRGANYGWSRCEGSRRFPDTSRPCDFGTRPVFDYALGNGRCAVTGGYVHRGPDAKAWRGLYIAGDFCGRLFVLNSKGKLKLSKNTGRNITSFGEDSAGRIFATDLDGSIYRVKLRGHRP
ncbi:MAG: sorbosone dehydrogenase family protein [Chloroflexota bacterium]